MAIFVLTDDYRQNQLLTLAHACGIIIAMHVWLMPTCLWPHGCLENEAVCHGNGMIPDPFPFSVGYIWLCETKIIMAVIHLSDTDN